MADKIESAEKIDVIEHNPDASSVKTYLIANAIFWVWLVCMYLIAQFLIHDTKGLIYVLGVLGVAFTIVSIADFVFDRLIENEI